MSNTEWTQQDIYSTIIKEEEVMNLRMTWEDLEAEEGWKLSKYCVLVYEVLKKITILFVQFRPCKIK